MNEIPRNPNFINNFKTEKEFNLRRAEARYQLLRNAQSFLKEEKQRLGKAFRKKKALEDYAKQHDIAVNTYYRWVRDFTRAGARGLITKYKGSEPSGSKRSRVIIRLKRPSKKSVFAKIEIDALHPLTCITSLNQYIQNSSAFDPFVKSSFNTLVDTMGIAHDGGKAMLLPRKLTDDERERLHKYRLGNHKNQSVRALGLLMMDNDCSLQEIILRTNRSRTSIYRWVRNFKNNGIEFVKTKPFSEARYQMIEQRKIRVLDMMHTPPSTYGVHRSEWTLCSLSEAYRARYGEHVPIKAVSNILKDEGYSWRRVHKVLTSNDPKYKEKTERLVNTLNSLKTGDAFFFIDEAGPWQVKKYGGRSWMAKGEERTIPVHQKSKGHIYWIAALEIQSNQVLWQYIDGKNAKSLIAMLEMILERYRAHSRIFLTWDALSTHNSKAVNNWIGAINFKARWESYPSFHVCPLPTRAQFLNVVETTFANTRRAVIHNSNYESVEEMKAAIDGYLNNRNQHFKNNPKRAGNKIWNKEIFKKKEWIKGVFRRM